MAKTADGKDCGKAKTARWQRPRDGKDCEMAKTAVISPSISLCVISSSFTMATPARSVAPSPWEPSSLSWPSHQSDRLGLYATKSSLKFVIMLSTTPSSRARAGPRKKSPRRPRCFLRSPSVALLMLKVRSGSSSSSVGGCRPARSCIYGS